MRHASFKTDTAVGLKSTITALRHWRRSRILTVRFRVSHSRDFQTPHFHAPMTMCGFFVSQDVDSLRSSPASSRNASTLLMGTESTLDAPMSPRQQAEQRKSPASFQRRPGLTREESMEDSVVDAWHPGFLDAAAGKPANNAATEAILDEAHREGSTLHLGREPSLSASLKNSGTANDKTATVGLDAPNPVRAGADPNLYEVSSDSNGSDPFALSEDGSESRAGRALDSPNEAHSPGVVATSPLQAMLGNRAILEYLSVELENADSDSSDSDEDMERVADVAKEKEAGEDGAEEPPDGSDRLHTFGMPSRSPLPSSARTKTMSEKTRSVDDHDGDIGSDASPASSTSRVNAVAREQSELARSVRASSGFTNFSDDNIDATQDTKTRQDDPLIASGRTFLSGQTFSSSPGEEKAATAGSSSSEDPEEGWSVSDSSSVQGSEVLPPHGGGPRVRDPSPHDSRESESAESTLCGLGFDVPFFNRDVDSIADEGTSCLTCDIPSLWAAVTASSAARAGARPESPVPPSPAERCLAEEKDENSQRVDSDRREQVGSHWWRSSGEHPPQKHDSQGLERGSSQRVQDVETQTLGRRADSDERGRVDSHRRRSAGEHLLQRPDSQGLTRASSQTLQGVEPHPLGRRAASEHLEKVDSQRVQRSDSNRGSWIRRSLRQVGFGRDVMRIEPTRESPPPPGPESAALEPRGSLEGTAKEEPRGSLEGTAKEEPRGDLPRKDRAPVFGGGPNRMKPPSPSGKIFERDEDTDGDTTPSTVVSLPNTKARRFSSDLGGDIEDGNWRALGTDGSKAAPKVVSQDMSAAVSRILEGIGDEETMVLPRAPNDDEKVCCADQCVPDPKMLNIPLV